MKTMYLQWKQKFESAVTERDKGICRRMMQKFQTADEEILPEKILPEIVKTYHTKFGEVIWYPNEKMIECQGAKFTEFEILKLAGSGLAVTDFELHLKKVFPFTELTDISELTF